MSHISRKNRNKNNPASSPISSKRYPGAKRYRYYRHGKYHYFYTARKEINYEPARLLLGIFFLPFIIVILVILAGFFGNRFHDYDTKIIVRDEAQVLSSDSALKSAMTAFYEKTHITPAVITVSNEAWQSGYSSLKDYASYRYQKAFKDEKHWLIVYFSAADFCACKQRLVSGKPAGGLSACPAARTVLRRMVLGNRTREADQ